MAEDRNSYRNITKSIGIFGGTKVFQILVGLIKNKIVAVLLGPVGMGIQGMLTSTTQLVSSFTGLGLHTSAVRDVAQAYNCEDQDRVNTTVSILRRLVIITGLLGTLLVFLFARTLSVWSFGNEDYTIAFRLISIILFFDQIVVGQTVLMQGTFHYKYMAASSLWGSLAGLIVCVPLYYLWGVKAIVPVIIITSLCNLIIASYYAKKVPYQRKNLSWKAIWTGGKVMITLGISIALVCVLDTGRTYIIRAYLSSAGTLEAVGLYTAGATIVTQYINVVFQSMGSDYTPRLAAAATDKDMFVEVMNRQAHLLITIVSPLIILFVIFSREIILLLYTDTFLPIIGMVEWMMIGMLFRSLSWAMSFAFTAKGDSKLFFINELLSKLYSIPLLIFGYKFYGYVGMGIGFCVTYVIYSVQEYLMTRKIFQFRFNNVVIKKCFPMMGLCFVFSIILITINGGIYRYLIGLVFLVIISLISYRWMDEMINIKDTIAALMKRIRK